MKRTARPPRGLIAFTFGLALAVSPAQARDVGEFGGYDGSIFREPCRGGDVLIGLSMMTGKALDRVTPICIDITPQRTWTGEAYEGNWAGGRGGNYQKIACEPGHAVTHITVWQDRNGAINHVALICQDLNSGHWYDVVAASGGEAIADRQLSCGQGEYGSGIYGKSHDLVTSFGFMCEMVSEAPPPPAMVPPPPVMVPPAKKPVPAADGMRITAEVTGYDAPGGNDRCYLNPGDTAELIEVYADDPAWKHLQGAGVCDGQDFWIYDDGKLDEL
jgi:hypothetical protein